MQYLLCALIALACSAQAAPVSSPLRLFGRSSTNATCADRSYAGDSDLAISIPSGPPVFYLESDLQTVYEIRATNASYSNQDFCGIANDTCLFVFTEGASGSFENCNLTKFGYDSDLNQASFFGVNAVINVANASTLTSTGVNMTGHNGCAGWYSYGTGTTVTVDDSEFWATGPVSHGLYASGNGTIYSRNFYCRTEGYRSSCLSGDNPAGYLHVNDSKVEMYGLGSAVAYTVGETYLYNVTGYTYQSFALIADGPQKIDIRNSDIEGGINFATVTLFGSQPGIKQSQASFYNTTLRSHGADHAIFGFGNIDSTVYADSLVVISESGMLAVSNATGITQDFDHWRNAAQGAAADAATAAIYLSMSNVTGSIQAINGSSLALHLGNDSSWTGHAIEDSTENEAFIGIYLDATSTWIVDADSQVQNLSIAGNTLTNIQSGGHTITYNATSSVNSWLNMTQHALSGGGSLTPSS